MIYNNVCGIVEEISKEKQNIYNLLKKKNPKDMYLTKQTKTNKKELNKNQEPLNSYKKKMKKEFNLKPIRRYGRIEDCIHR